MKVILISDNHGIKNEINMALKNNNFDFSVHLGDGMLEDGFIEKNFDFYVNGNNDCFGPFEKIVEIGNLKILLMHGHTKIEELYSNEKMFILATKLGVNAVFHGHTHIYKNEKINGIHIICPGSINFARGKEGNGYALVEIKKNKISRVKFKNVE